MMRVRRFLRQDHSMNWLDVLGFLLNAGVTLLCTAGGLYVATVLSLPENEKYNIRRWVITGAGSIVLTLFTYVREVIVTKSKNRKLRDSKLVYDLIGGAIEELIQIRECSDGEIPRVIVGILKYVERTVKVALKTEGVESGQLCANLMIKRSNPERLELEYFGTHWRGRTKRSLPIKGDNLLPGAPEAYELGEVMYIDDTQSDKYARYFDPRRTYRSVLSVPIPTGGEPVFAVLNVDSTVPGQFQSVDFINKLLIPVVSSFVGLLRLEKDAILSVGSNENKDDENARGVEVKENDGCH